MTLTAQELSYLKNSKVRECKTRFWLFDAPAVDFTHMFANTEDFDPIEPLTLVSPPYALIKPGESIELYAGDSIDIRWYDPCIDFVWSLVSGSAILSPSGSTCLVTPTGGEDSTVIVRCNSTNSVEPTMNANRDVTIAVSTNGWAKPTGTISISGGYAEQGWSGSVEVAGDSAVGLSKGKLLLIHIDTIYDGVSYTIGGYKRAQNLCLLVVDTWSYEDNAEGHKICRINLISPKDYLNQFTSYQADTAYDGDPRFLSFHDTPAYGIYLPGQTLSAIAATIAIKSYVSQYFNVTLFQDNYLCSHLRVDVGPLFDQIASPALCNLCLAMVDFTGGINLIPHPAVRADEWYGTPSPIWDASNPLTTEYCSRTVQYYPEYPGGGGAGWGGLIMTGYTDDGLPKSYTAGNVYLGQQVNKDYNGYILDRPYSYGAEEQWPIDLLAYINRTWDLTATLFCIGNTLNVGSFVYLDMDPDQGGQPAVSGLAFCDAISHSIDTERGMQTTTAHFCQLTGSIA